MYSDLCSSARKEQVLPWSGQDDRNCHRTLNTASSPTSLRTSVPVVLYLSSPPGLGPRPCPYVPSLFSILTPVPPSSSTGSVDFRSESPVLPPTQCLTRSTTPVDPVLRVRRTSPPPLSENRPMPKPQSLRGLWSRTPRPGVVSENVCHTSYLLTYLLWETNVRNSVRVKDL